MKSKGLKIFNVASEAPAVVSKATEEIRLATIDGFNHYVDKHKGLIKEMILNDHLTQKRLQYALKPNATFEQVSFVVLEIMAYIQDLYGCKECKNYGKCEVCQLKVFMICFDKFLIKYNNKYEKQLHEIKRDEHKKK